MAYMTFINNSCRGIFRPYQGFDLAIPGNKTVDADVPEEFVENVKAFLSEHFPAVQIVANGPIETEEEEAVMFLPEAATSFDASIVDINAEEEETEEETAPEPEAQPETPAVQVTAPAAPRATRKNKKTGGRK